jgi:hypothetical protein
MLVTLHTFNQSKAAVEGFQKDVTRWLRKLNLIET